MITPCHSAKDLIAWFRAQPNQDRLTYEELPGVTLLSGYPKIVDQGRWETFKEAILLLGDGSFVRVSWAEGSTEYQDSYPNMDLVEVEPYQEIVIKYRRKKEGE